MRELGTISSSEASSAKFIISGAYALVIDGEKNTKNSNKYGHSTSKTSRTLLGWRKADRSLILVVVQGSTNESKGVTANESAQIMVDLGCECAINLDGGGSSEMIVNGRIKNIPTDGCERHIGSAVLVYGPIEVAKLPVLSAGDKGAKKEYIKFLQSKLTSLGYSTNGIDGSFGTGTKKAVKKFQSDFRIPYEYGSVGIYTWSKLFQKIRYPYRVKQPTYFPEPY